MTRQRVATLRWLAPGLPTVHPACRAGKPSSSEGPRQGAGGGGGGPPDLSKQHPLPPCAGSPRLVGTSPTGRKSDDSSDLHLNPHYSRLYLLSVLQASRRQHPPLPRRLPTSTSHYSLLCPLPENLSHPPIEVHQMCNLPPPPLQTQVPALGFFLAEIFAYHRPRKWCPILFHCHVVLQCWAPAPGSWALGCFRAFVSHRHS